MRTIHSWLPLAAGPLGLAISTADGSRLHYEATVTDPAAFVEPIEFSAQWIYVPGVTVEPYNCIDG